MAEEAFAAAISALEAQSAAAIAALGAQSAALRAALEKGRQELAEEREAVKKERAALDKEKEQMVGFVERNGSDIVSFNVGGEVMSASRKTLVQAEGSILEAIFSGRYDQQPLARDSEGRVFFNHSPAPFKSVLSCLRVREDAQPGQAVARPEVPPEFRAELACILSALKLGDFFRGSPRPAFSPPPPQALTWAPPQHNPDAVVLTGSVMTKAQSSSGYCAVLGSAPLIGADPGDQTASWKVSVSSLDVSSPNTNGWFAFGVIGIPEAGQHAHNHSTSFCWGPQNCVYFSGQNASGRGGWVAWQSDDVAILRLDAGSAPKLRMFLKRTRTVYDLPLPSDADARRMRAAVSLYGSVRVELAAANVQELQEAGLADA